MSPTWYTYLEQGRNIRPSAEVLDSLARVLVLSEDERRYMHTLAYGHTSVAPPERTEQDGVDLLRRVVAVAANGADPVYAPDRFCDVHAWNDAAAEWYTDFGRLPDGQRNMLLWMLTDPLAQERFADWEYDVTDVIARFRWVSAPYRGHPRLEAIIAAADQAHPRFGEWWRDHDVRVQRSRDRRLRHPELGERSWQISALFLADFDNLCVVFHLPT